MAEILVAARDLPSGYARGDPITVQSDGHPWGAGEGLPNFVVLLIPGSVIANRNLAAPLVEDAIAGDPEFDAPDVEDRVIVRGRAHIRFDLDAIGDGPGVRPVPDMSAVTSTLIYNRKTGNVEIGL